MSSYCLQALKRKLLQLTGVTDQFIGQRRNHGGIITRKHLSMLMNLQFSSRPGDGGFGDEGQQGNLPAGSQETPIEVKEENNTGKIFSRDEVTKMITAETNRVKAVWEKELAAKKEEARKLAKMNAEKKLQYELEQKEAEIVELERNQTLSEMKSEASKMLSSASLSQDDELLGLIISEDAEATKKTVSTITKLASQIKKGSARQSILGEGGQLITDRETKQTVANLAAKSRIIKQEE